MPRSRARSQTAFTGRICPVRLIWWDIRMIRVLSVMAPRNPSTTSSSVSAGVGIWMNLRSNALPAHPLADGGEHPPVVLGGGEDLVAGLEIHAQQQDLHGFGGVPDERDLLGVASEEHREPLADVFLPGLEDLPHRVDGSLLRFPDVADERLGDHAG